MLLLASDLDGTFLPNGESAFNEDFYPMFCHWLEIRRKKIKLVYITGRDFDLALDGITQYQIPEPDFLVCDVGASLYMRVPVETDIAKDISKDFHWKLSPIWKQKIETDFLGFQAKDIAQWMQGISDLYLQEESRQTDFKISFYYDWQKDPALIIDQAQKICSQNGINAQIITSIDHTNKKGLLDILPLSANKEKALDFLVEALRLEKNQVMYCGDTGNDLEPLTSSYMSVLVGNADDSFRAMVRRQAEERGTLDATFFAQKPYAQGIAEALYHFGWIKQPLEDK